MSIRDRILEIDDITREQVLIKEWGFEVEVRSMTGAARAQVLDRSQTADGKRVDIAKWTPEIVAMCTFDPATGEQVFGDDDRELIMSKNSAALSTIMKVAIRLSGLEEEATDAAKKDLSTTPEEGSSLI